MAQLVELKFAHGAKALVEVEEGTQVGVARIVASIDKVIDDIVADEIINHCRILQKAFAVTRTMEFRPKKAKAEFGFKMSAKGDIYLVSTSVEASYKVSFEWDL